MTLTRNGIQGGTVEQLVYAPSIQTSNDLEAATKTVNATSEQAGADYTSALTIPAPTDSRLAVTRLAGRLQVTIDSWAGGGTTLNYRIKKGGTSVSTGTLETGGTTGVKLIVWDETASLAVGAANTYTVFLWVNSGSCVVSVCQLWLGVGSKTNSAWGLSCLTINHTGPIDLVGRVTRQGTGNAGAYIVTNDVDGAWQTIIMDPGGTAGTMYFKPGATNVTTFLSPGLLYLRVYGSVATDIAYLGEIGVRLQQVG